MDDVAEGNDEIATGAPSNRVTMLIFRVRHAQQFKNYQQGQGQMHYQIENINRARQASRRQHLQFLPQMRFGEKRSQS